jgi:hypothetical protein
MFEHLLTRRAYLSCPKSTIEQGNRVAFFGSFTYKSNVTGREITSPFGLLARFEGDKVAYIQFLKDTYGTAGGATRFQAVI